jgi:hypothetical protein
MDMTTKYKYTVCCNKILHPDKECPFKDKCWFSHDEYLIKHISPLINEKCSKYLEVSEFHWLYNAKNVAFKLRHYAENITTLNNA